MRADAPGPDILVLPGGRADNAMSDAALMAWMKTAADGADHVLTICYGSFIAGKLGLVDDKRGASSSVGRGAVARYAVAAPNGCGPMTSSTCLTIRSQRGSANWNRSLRLMSAR